LTRSREIAIEDSRAAIRSCSLTSTKRPLHLVAQARAVRMGEAFAVNSVSFYHMI
jgi:hypothetical protein